MSAWSHDPPVIPGHYWLRTPVVGAEELPAHMSVAPIDSVVLVIEEMSGGALLVLGWICARSTLVPVSEIPAECSWQPVKRPEP